MSREVKRVDFGFDWPLQRVWEGYRLPDRLREAPCPADCSAGSSPAGEWLNTLVYLLLMLPDEVQSRGNPRRSGRLHPWLESMEFRPAVAPSEEIIELTSGLAGRAPRTPFGHDAIDNWRAQRAVIEAAGLDPKVWGRCPTCEGHGSVEAYRGQRAAAERWERSEPPAGEGWQLWETTTEGSPISPVFASAEALAEWLTSRSAVDAHAVGAPMTLQAARRFVSEGWAPTIVSDASGVVDGSTWVGRDR